MQKLLDINGSDSCFSSRDNSQKKNNEQIKSELFDNMPDSNKKGKKLFIGKKLAIKMNHWILPNAIALERHCLKKITKKVWAREDIKVLKP